MTRACGRGDGSRRRAPRSGDRLQMRVAARAAGEGPHGAGIDSNCESRHEADTIVLALARWFKEAEVTQGRLLLL